MPRVTQPNLESLRDEFFDVVARIKVPKCKAFHDVRSPCPDSTLESRNKAVLCPKGEIDRDTLFFQQVQALRNERAAKNFAIKLYIPGRIIHLVDTLKDGTKYVPYWASRYEFNQVILSGRMLSDHSLPPLVNILRGLNLDDVHEVKTWNVDPDKEEDKEDEIFVLIPFSNPQGKIPQIIVMIAFVACIMDGLSNQVCRYVTRIATITHNGTSRPGHNFNVGFWAYQLKQCIDTVENCDETSPYDVEDSDYCQIYNKSLFADIDASWASARAFGVLSVLLGIFGMCLASMATCTKLKRRTWVALAGLFLLVTLCQGFQFLIFSSRVCNEWTVPEEELYTELGFVAGSVVTVECTLSTGGKLGMSATIFWFIIAVGCSHMVSKA